MRAAASFSLARSIKKQLYPFRGGILPSLERKKPGNEESAKRRITIADEKATEPIVTFSRPPPLPPFFGPVVALSLFDLWLKGDSNDA